MVHATRARMHRVLVFTSLSFLSAGSLVSAATYTAPRQLSANDIYQLDPDNASGDEETTCPKIDLNNGAGGDNPYYQRTNVARAHVGGCSGRYWYTSNFQMLCTDPTPVNTCGGGPCIDEPDVNGAQYVDYAPPFGNGVSELTPGRYKIIGEYRNTTSRATYPAEYIVTHAGGTTTVLKSQLDGADGSCPSFDIGIFDLTTGSKVRVNDTGNSSITFNRMRFQLVSAPGGAPLANAGPDQTIFLPNSAALTGAVSDDGQPSPLTATWSQVSGPGNVGFLDASSPSTTANFSVAGTYVLRLTAFDGANSASDDVTVTVLAQGSNLTYSTQYEFDAGPDLAAGVIDADPGDANGNGLLIKVGNGWGNSPGGIANGILHFVDRTDTGNHGYYWQNNGGNISFTIDMAVRVTSGVGGTSNRRSMGFSAGPSKNLGLRLHKTNDGGTTSCTVGSIRFAGGSGGTGPEGCEDFTTDAALFHRIRVSVDAVTNSFNVWDLDTQTLLTTASGGGGGALSWGDQINSLGGYHIGSLSESNTNPTNYELDYFRVLLGIAINSPSTVILPIGLCHNPAADADGDSDVDMDDFGKFQACYTGQIDLISDNSCRCFDRNSDNHIEEVDFNAFNTCASTSRAGVPANVSICNGS